MTPPRRRRKDAPLLYLKACSHAHIFLDICWSPYIVSSASLSIVVFEKCNVVFFLHRCRTKVANFLHSFAQPSACRLYSTGAGSRRKLYDFANPVNSVTVRNNRPSRIAERLNVSKRHAGNVSGRKSSLSSGFKRHRYIVKRNFQMRCVLVMQTIKQTKVMFNLTVKTST